MYMYIEIWDLTKMAFQISEQRINHLTNAMGTTGYPFGKKNQVKPPPSYNIGK